MVYLGKTIEREFYYSAGKEVLYKGRILRKKMTSSEKILWQYLRNKKFLGKIFRRQHPVSQFIVDFYCHQAKLVIEVDGSIHNIKENKEYDENRTFELESFGLKVIRFKNEEIKNNIQYVLKIIESEIKERIQPGTK
jgi:very-short-patch-repair endonuclease